MRGARLTRTFDHMLRLHVRHRLWPVTTIGLLVLVAACGSGDDDDAATDDDRQAASAPADSGSPSAGERPGAGADAPPATGPGDATAAGCVLDEATVGDAIGVEVIGIGDCDFAAGAAAGEAVTWSVELYVDATIPEALTDGTPVDGLGDSAVWNEALGVLSVQAGDRYFQVQPLRLGEAPIALNAQELAQTIAGLVIERS
jgi:hypothetical protein